MAAHARGDGTKLAHLYLLAAQEKSDEGDADAAGFLLTQAYVFALESGSDLATPIRRKLVAAGRDTPEDGRA